MDLAPLRTSRDFRLLFSSRTATLFGTQAAEVALLVQAKQLTGSAFQVGLLGAVELVPLMVCGLYGGTLADRLDRRLLFPFMAATLHATWAVGLMFAAPPAGAVAATLVTGRLGRVCRHGRAIAISAAA